MASRTTTLAVLLLLAFSSVGGILLMRPAFAQTLSLSVSSPTAGSTFERGQSVTLTATLTDGGSLVNGATVTATSPTGATIILGPSSAGIYSGTYAIASTDPLGTWTIDFAASNGGQTTSAEVQVTISSSALLVSFTSPPAITTFNVGETAVVSSLVTFPDGSPIPSSSSVSFTEPNGAIASMAPDSADSSGKTWTGSHTITTSDVPTQGFDWPITVTASASGETGTATEHALLYSSLLVGVSTFSSSVYTTTQTSFSAGQTVFVEAQVNLHDSTTVSSGTVSFEISGTSVSTTPVSMTYSPTLGAWTGSYVILTTDSQGVQTVSVSASDGLGNAGSGSTLMTIGASSQGLAVSITTPASGATFNRGQVATITATVTQDGALVSGATVTATTPTGGSLTLTNTAGGSYSGTYTVSSADPAGSWRILVEATLSGQLGAAEVSATVSDSLMVTASTFNSASYAVPASSFMTGQTAYIKSQVTLQDGASVTSGIVVFELSGSSIASTAVAMAYDSSLGTWTGSYTVLSSDQTGNQILTVSATDLNGNAGSGTKTVAINSPVTTSQGLEASITFNATSHGIEVNAICGTGCVGPTTVTLTNSSSDHGQGDGQGDDGFWQAIVSALPQWFQDGQGNHGDHSHHEGGNGNHGNSHQTQVYTITDSAGHSLTLTVNTKDEGHEVHADVLGIQYGTGQVIHPSHDEINFEYSVAKGGSINTLEQNARINGTNAQAHYNSDKDNTTITISSNSGSPTSVTENGLWLLELVTQNGQLEVSYSAAP